MVSLSTLNSEMKRFLRVTLGLVLLFAVCSFTYDGVVLWLMRRSPSCNAVKIERAVQGGQGERAAIFGSSRALGNYVPSIFGEETFNYGVNGMSINEAIELVVFYLEKNQSDSTVIINVDPWGEGSAQGKFVLRGDYTLVATDKHIRESMPGLSLSWSEWMPGLRFQGMLRSVFAQYMNAKKSVTKKIEKGAELLMSTRTQTEWAVIKKDLKEYSFVDLSDRQLERLYANQGNHRIVWAVAPTCRDHHDKLKNPDSLKNFLVRQASRSNVLTVNCFDQTVDYPDSFFADPTHLNIDGAKKFTGSLMLELNTIINEK